MPSRLKTTALALAVFALLAVTVLPVSASIYAATSNYDEPRCRGYADDGEHQRAADCYYDHANARNRSSGPTRYEDTFELLGFAIVEARLAGDKFTEARAFMFQANLEGIRFDKPASATQRAEDAALLFLQVNPDEQFDDESRFVRLIKLRVEVANAYRGAGLYAEDDGDLERAYEMHVTGARSIADAHRPAGQSAAELITTDSRGERLELGSAGFHKINFTDAVQVADKMEEPGLVVKALLEFIATSREFTEAGFERADYTDATGLRSEISSAARSDYGLLMRLNDRFDTDYEYAMSGASGATDLGTFFLHEGLVQGYGLIAREADQTHEEFIAASRMYERATDLLENNYAQVRDRDRNLERAAEYLDLAAEMARRAGELDLAEEQWIRGAELFERHVNENNVDRTEITLSYSKLDAVYYANAGLAAQDRGDCSRADAWFRKQAEALRLYDDEAHEPRECRPPANLPTPIPTNGTGAQPTATTTSTDRPDPDAALDDLLNTFGRMTREVAEERIKVEMKTNLEDLAAWLGQQMQDYLEDSADFLDEVYDSLPEFTWEELEDAGDIPADVEEQPDDPGGPGLSFEDLIDAMGKKVPIPSNLDFESGEDLYNLVTAMLWAEDPDSGRFIRTRASGGEVIELKRQDGTTVKTGVFVTPDGRVMYTTDGTNYYSSLPDAIDPSYGRQGIEWYRSVTGYVWQRGLEGRSLNDELQLMNNISAEVLDDFRREMSSSSASSAPEGVYDELKDPFKDVKGIGGDPYAALEGKATKSAHDYLEGQLWDPVKDKLKGKRNEWLWAAAEKALDSSIEFEARQNFKFMLKEYQDLGTDALTAWEDMKKKAGLDLFELTGIGKKAAASGEFMVSAIQQMGKGLQDSDFGVRARAYIQVRQTGQSPVTVWKRTRDGELPELEVSAGRFTRSGIESTMAQQGIPPEVHLGISFSLYEQAYQRFLLAEEMGRKS